MTEPEALPQSVGIASLSLFSPSESGPPSFAFEHDAWLPSSLPCDTQMGSTRLIFVFVAFGVTCLLGSSTSLMCEPCLPTFFSAAFAVVTSEVSAKSFWLGTTADLPVFETFVWLSPPSFSRVKRWTAVVGALPPPGAPSSASAEPPATT